MDLGCDEDGDDIVGWVYADIITQIYEKLKSEFTFPQACSGRQTHSESLREGGANL